MNTTAPDLSTNPPRSGHEQLGGYAWLARLADKVRADHAGTAGEYIAYCGLSKGFLERAGVAQSDFDLFVRNGASDADLVRFFDQHVDDASRERANTYVLDEMHEHLVQQDAEEGRAPV